MLDINNEIEEKIMGYPWKGNVRELKNIAQRYVIFNEIDLDEKEIISEDDLEEKAISEDVKRFDNDKVIDLKEINRFVEEKVIEMLSSQGMTKIEIAKKLGISRTALWKKTKS